jgi:hypothetical protein
MRDNLRVFFLRTTPKIPTLPQQKEEANKRKIMESEQRKLESDLNRLRKQRDGLQLTLDTLKSSSKSKLDPETKTLLEAQKERIKCLEMDVQRLLNAIGKDSDNLILKEFLKEKLKEGFEHPVEYYHGKWKEVQGRVQELEEGLKRFEEASQDVLDKSEVFLGTMFGKYRNSPRVKRF